LQYALFSSSKGGCMFGNPTDPYSAKNGLCSLENDSQLCNDKTTRNI